MLKYGEVNPLNVHGLRELDHIPPHFSKVEFQLFVHVGIIKNWIWENQTGRFCCDQSINSNTVIGFELPAEASHFALMLDQLNKPLHFGII